MKIREFYDALLKYAPLELSKRLCETDGGYDNSGVIVGFDSSEELSGAVFALDLSFGAVDLALKRGCNLIVTHHPAIYSPIKSIEANSPIYKCIQNGISVISMHLNVDCAERGTDYYFAEGLGAEKQIIIDDFGGGTGYGRISEIEEVTAKQLLDRYKMRFKSESVILYGDANRKISKIGTFCGAGLDERTIDESLKAGVDLVASADIRHHVLLKAINSGLAVLYCTHYACENYGMNKICENFAVKYKNEKIIYFDDERLS